MRIIYLTIGIIMLGIGAVGAALPFLPAFPFLLAAAFCFAKSSDRLHNWFIGTKMYKNNLESYIKKRGMTRAAKTRLILVVTATMSVGFIMMHKVPTGRIVLGIVWFFHVVYFVFGVKTITEEQQEEYRRADLLEKEQLELAKLQAIQNAEHTKLKSRKQDA